MSHGSPNLKDPPASASDPDLGWRRREPPATLAARAVLGVGLRRARLFRGCTQTTLQDRSGVDQSIISRLELGRVVQIRLRRFLDLVGVLGVEDVILVPAEPDWAVPRSSVEELLERGRWASADARARAEIHATVSRRRSA